MTDRLAALIAEIERVPDPSTRAAVQELVRLVLDLHGEALARVLELVGDANEDLLRRIATDDVLRPVYELHDLAPPQPASTPVTFLPRRTG